MRPERADLKPERADLRLEWADTPLLDPNVAKRTCTTPKLFIVIRSFFFSLIDNLIKFFYKQRISHRLKN